MMTVSIAELVIRIDSTQARLAAIELDRLSSRSRNAEHSTDRLSASFSSLGRILAGVTAGFSAMQLATQMLKTIEQVQSLDTRLQALTKGAKDYANVQSFLVGLSQAHHKSNLALQASFAQLLTIEQTGVITRKQSQDILIGMSNAQSMTGATAEALSQSMIGLTQALGMGTVGWEEIKQVTEPIPGLMQKIAVAAGFAGESAIGDFKKLVASAALTSTMFGETLPTAFATYNGAALSTADNLTSKYKDVENAWIALAKTLESPVNDALSPVLKFVAWQLEEFVKQVSYLKWLLSSSAPSSGAPDNGMADLRSAAFISNLDHAFKQTSKQMALTKDQQDAIILNGTEYLELIFTINDANKKRGETSHKSVDAQINQVKDLLKEQLSAYSLETDQLNAAYAQNLINSQQYHDKQIDLIKKERDAKLATGDSSAIYESMRKTLAADEQLRTSKQTYIEDMEQERLKLVELTGTTQDYINAKYSKEKLNRDDLFQRATPGDKQLIETVNSAQKQQELTAHTREFNQELHQIEESYQRISLNANSAFSSMNEGLGQVAQGFEGLINGMQDVNKQIAANKLAFEDDLATHKYTTDEKEAKEKAYSKKGVELEKDRSLVAISGMRQTTNAIGKMFGENTVARKAFHVVEMTLGAIELATNISRAATTIATNIGLMASNIATGATAMFAQSGWAGFAGVAAMLAVIAGLGVSAFGGGKSSARIPVSSDTGTVLGDTNASSNSVINIYELLKDIHYSEYRELREINEGVTVLNSSITNVITKLFQGGGISDPKIDVSTQLSGVAKTMSTITAVAGGLAVAGSGVLAGLAVANAGMTVGISAAMGALTAGIGLIVGFILQKLGVMEWLMGGLFGKITKSVVGAGIATNATQLSNLMNGGGIDAFQYATIETKKKSWFKTKTTYSEIYSALDNDTQDALTNVFRSMGDTMFSLADELGGDLTQRVNDYVIPAMRVELKGLSSEDASKKLNGVISAALDKMSESIFGDALGQYQQLGEGMLETTVRIVSEMAVVKEALSQSGLSLTQNIIMVSDALVQAAAGLKAFQKQFESYYDKFYTDEEKAANTKRFLSGALDDLGLKLPETRMAYRQTIEALDINNQLDQQRYSLLLQVASAADEYYKSLENIMKTYVDLEAWLNKDKRSESSGSSPLTRNAEYLTQIGTSYLAVKGGDLESMGKLTSLVDEYKGFYQQYAPASFADMSRWLHEAMTALLPSHATGLASVPYDGYIAKLHKGERVLTAQEANNADNADLLMAIIQTEREGFKQVIAELKASNKSQADMKASARRAEVAA